MHAYLLLNKCHQGEDWGIQAVVMLVLHVFPPPGESFFGLTHVQVQYRFCYTTLNGNMVMEFLATVKLVRCLHIQWGANEI